MNHPSSLSEARSMIERFRVEKENMLLPQFQWTNTFPHCVVFTRATFEKILTAPGCEFIQIFPAMDMNNRVSFIVAGAATNDGALAENVFVENGCM